MKLLHKKNLYKPISMNSKVKYGLISTLGWLTYIYIIFYISRLVNSEVSPEKLLWSKQDTIYMNIFLIITCCLWFYIGYSLRNKYINHQQYYLDINQELTEKDIKSAFKKHFISKNSKLLVPLSILSIPMYLIYNWDRTFITLDYYVIAILIFISLGLLACYKYFKQCL